MFVYNQRAYFGKCILQKLFVIVILKKDLPIQAWSILQKDITTRDYPIKANYPPKEWDHCIDRFTSFSKSELKVIKISKYIQFIRSIWWYNRLFIGLQSACFSHPGNLEQADILFVSYIFMWIFLGLVLSPHITVWFVITTIDKLYSSQFFFPK